MKIKRIFAALCAVTILAGCSSEKIAEDADDKYTAPSKNFSQIQTTKDTDELTTENKTETSDYDGDSVEKFTVETQSIGLEGVSNARQLGGYPAADGKHVKQNVLLRSGALAGATDGDIEKLKALGLTEIIDFRTTAEVKASPDPIIEGVIKTSIHVLDESNSDDSNAAAMTQIYAASDNPAEVILNMYRLGYLSDDMYSSIFDSDIGIAGMRAFIDRLLENDGVILFHCTGGKDRAGTAAVILLTLLGVNRETVMHDFLLTNDFNAKTIEAMKNAAKELTENEDEIEGVGALIGVSRESMEHLFDIAEEQNGSLLEYIKDKLGVTDDEIATLREKYLS